MLVSFFESAEIGQDVENFAPACNVVDDAALELQALGLDGRVYH
jgi:hypothetical protein